MRRISSYDRKPFSITVRSAPPQSEVWNWKTPIVDTSSIPQNQLRGGSASLVDCADVLSWLNGSWSTGVLQQNNSAMYAACMTPVLSYKATGFPSILDGQGRSIGYPVFKVVVQARVLFVGKKSTQVGGDPNP